MNDKGTITIREYDPKDKIEIIKLLQLNTPDFFAPEEEKDLIHYLDNEIELYYVVVAGHLIVGCGGINFAENKTIGRISWDILHPDYQGKSLGTQLIKHRITKLKTIESVKKITVRTSQAAYAFYEKKGFNVLEIKKDYWAKGFDMYYMEYNPVESSFSK